MRRLFAYGASGELVKWPFVEDLGQNCAATCAGGAWSSPSRPRPVSTERVKVPLRLLQHESLVELLGLRGPRLTWLRELWRASRGDALLCRWGLRRQRPWAAERQ